MKKSAKLTKLRHSIKYRGQEPKEIIEMVIKVCKENSDEDKWDISPGEIERIKEGLDRILEENKGFTQQSAFASDVKQALNSLSNVTELRELRGKTTNRSFTNEFLDHMRIARERDGYTQFLYDNIHYELTKVRDAHFHGEHMGYNEEEVEGMIQDRLGDLDSDNIHSYTPIVEDYRERVKKLGRLSDDILKEKIKPNKSAKNVAQSTSRYGYKI
jgi:hypothetical protein